MQAYIILEGIFTLDSSRRLGWSKNLLRNSQCIRWNRQDSWEICEILLTGNVFTLNCQIIVALWLLDGLKKSLKKRCQISLQINHCFRMSLLTMWINYVWHNGSRTLVCLHYVNIHPSWMNVNWNKVVWTTCFANFLFT